MSIGSSDILSAALSLPEDQRASLALELLHSLRPPGILSEDDPGFEEELQRRIDAFERDPTSGIPWEEAHRRIRDDLNSRRVS